ncbi:MAG: sensor histidine kinase [Clostridiales bacterium]|nr:sensor histidine kinase [Clostridiales bacterium]
MALPLGQKSVDAVGGVLDLRGADLSDAIYQLTGAWQYTPRQLLTPDEFPQNAPLTAIPEKWPQTYEDLNTYATYRLQIYTDDTRQLSLFVHEIYMAYKLWVNGEYIRGAGIVADNSAESIPEFEGVIVPVKAKDGIVEIVIQGSNFYYMRPIMNSLLLLGESDAAFAWFLRTRSLYTIALGIFIAGAIYHLAMYALRRKETVYLLFALLCFICFWRYAIDTNGLSNLAGWFSMNSGLADIKIFMMLFFLHSVAIATFSLYVFDHGWMKKNYPWALAYIVLGTALYGIIPWNTHLAAHIVVATMAPALFFAIYKAARSKRLREEKIMWLIFIALFLYTIVSAVQKYFFDHLLFMTGLITDMFLLLSQALILSKQFADIQKSEQLLSEKNEMLDRLNRMKTEFCQNMNHDFKTPLTVISTSILNAADMLDFELDKDEMKQSLGNAQREVMYMARMVDNAMKYSSLHNNRHNMGSVDIAFLLREGATTYSSMLERQGNTLTLDIPHSLPHIFGNADMLLQVLSNLLSNANRHTRNGEISVRAEEKNGMITVSVRDTGAGINPEILPRIFERGVSEGGTGLGIPICKNAIEAHGGILSIESEYGRGTLISFTLPLYENNEEEEQKNEQSRLSSVG